MGYIAIAPTINNGQVVPAQNLVATSSAVAFTTFNQATNLILLQVLQNNARATFDGTTPTGTNGATLFQGQTYHWDTQTAQHAKFIGAPGTTGAFIFGQEFVNSTTETASPNPQVIRPQPLEWALGHTEVYYSQYDNLTDAAAAALAGGTTTVLVMNAGQASVTASVSIPNPVRFCGGTFTIASTKVLTLAGGVIGSPTLGQLFFGAGTVQLNANTPAAYPEWWGATHNATGDDGAAINAGLLACWNGSINGSATFVYANQNYYLQTAVSQTHPVPVDSQPGATLLPSGSSAATTGITLGAYNYNCNSEFPSINQFSGTGLVLNKTSLARLSINTLSGNATGIQFIADDTGACLDNTIFAQVIANGGSGSTALKVTANKVSAGTGAIIQGNRVECNFINSNASWMTYTFGAGVTAASLDVNYWQADAVEFNAINNVIAINNQTGQEIAQETFVCTGFFAGLTGTTPKLFHGVFDQCSFNFGIGPGNVTTYAAMGMTEIVPGFGNQYLSGNGLAASTTGIAAATAPASAGTFNGGTAIYCNRIPLSFTFPTSLGAGGALAFYAYSPFALGNGRISLDCFGEIGVGGYFIEDGSGNVALPTQILDHNGSNANEIKFSFRNLSANTMASGTLLRATMVIGI